MKGIEIVYLHCKLPFGLNLSINTRFCDAVYGASSFLFDIGLESKTMKVSDLPVTKVRNKKHIRKMFNFGNAKAGAFLPSALRDQWVSCANIL